MREMVESAVARELLKHFLAAFVKDRSLFASMNAARQQLKQKFEPGKSWLPVIVANPLAQELTWNRLFSERRLSWQWEMVIGIVTIAVLICLPVGIYCEFQGWETLTLYAQLYPHLIIYPSLLLWMPLFAAYKAHCMIRVKARPFVVLTLLTIFLTLAGLLFELNSDRMMLMEFKPNAITTINARQLPQLYFKWKTSKTEILSIPQEIFNARDAFDREGNLTLKKSDLNAVVKHIYTGKDLAGSQGLLRIATAYDVWRQQPESFSIVRWCYALGFTAIIGCGVQIVTLVSTILFVPDSIFNKNRYLTYLIICELGILFWVPFEGYSIEHTKSLLFSPQFRGTLAGLNFLMYTIIAILSLATISSIYRSASKKYQPILYSFFFGSLGMMMTIGSFGTSFIDRLFGMNSIDPLTPWLSGSILFTCLFALLVRAIDFRVEEE